MTIEICEVNVLTDDDHTKGMNIIQTILFFSEALLGVGHTVKNIFILYRYNVLYKIERLFRNRFLESATVPIVLPLRASRRFLRIFKHSDLF